MSEQKQIEEIAKDLRNAEHWYYDEISCTAELDAQKTAKNLYNAGYRKQIEGEWVKVGFGITERVVCSQCNSEKGSFMRPPFCNQCGAKMKG